MSLQDIKESEACVLLEMQIKQEIDNDVDDYVLAEDGLFIKREDGSAIFREF